MSDRADKLAFVDAILDPEGHCVLCHDPSPGRHFYVRIRDGHDRLRGVCYPCVRARGFTTREAIDEIKREIYAHEG